MTSYGTDSPSSPTTAEDCPSALIRSTFLASITTAEIPKIPNKAKRITVWGTGVSAVGLSEGS